MQADAIKPGQSVIIIDDLIATGNFLLLFTYIGL
jgi:adenine/guanine phosphoribosyltransferase-like PRPP-binding protein